MMPFILGCLMFAIGIGVLVWLCIDSRWKYNTITFQRYRELRLLAERLATTYPEHDAPKMYVCPDHLLDLQEFLYDTEDD